MNKLENSEPEEIRKAHIGERSLVAAVLARALDDLGLTVATKTQRVNPYEAKLAREWIFSNRKDPYSFLWCAEVLDMDGIIIRRKLSEYHRARRTGIFIPSEDSSYEIDAKQMDIFSLLSKD